MATADDSIIYIRDLAFGYGGGPLVLDGLSAEIRRGSYVSVVGDNGCGKTTLMRLILGFLKPVSGTLRISARRIGYVPQGGGADSKGFPITVEEALGAYAGLIRSKEAPAEALARVGAAGLEKKLFGDLSGGQRQKVLIARALMGRTDLLILDEPSTGVDLKGRREIYQLLKRLNEGFGLTVVSVEHNLEAAVANSTDILHVAGGKVHVCAPRRYASETISRRLFS